jgi:hypothetical protein
MWMTGLDHDYGEHVDKTNFAISAVTSGCSIKPTSTRAAWSVHVLPVLRGLLGDAASVPVINYDNGATNILVSISDGNYNSTASITVLAL